MRSGHDRMMHGSYVAAAVWLCMQGLVLGGAAPAQVDSIYHDGWIDFNKNGRMDPYEYRRAPQRRARGRP
jgi:hypothetical protein